MGRGLLVFKGGEKAAPHKKKSSSKKKKKKKSSRRDSDGEGGGGHDGSGVTGTDGLAAASSSSSVAVAAAATSAAATTQDRDQKMAPERHSSSKSSQPPPPPPSQPQVRKGTGKITTSGSVVTGHGTNFTGEFRMGDALIVRNDNTKGGGRGGGVEEMRVVKMRLSDISCGLSSAFSRDRKSPSDFWYISAPRDVRAEDRKKRDEASKVREEVDRLAFGTYAGTEEVVYREKTAAGGYRIRKERIDAGEGKDGKVTRTDLLDFRSKKKSDKYC